MLVGKYMSFLHQLERPRRQSSRLVYLSNNYNAGRCTQRMVSPCGSYRGMSTSRDLFLAALI